MERLAESDPAASAEGPPGTLRWTPNDAYAQAHGNKPEYAGRVRGVSKNILPARGSIHSYYTLSPARSQNAPSSAVVSEMIAEALTVRDEQHKQEMEERLTKQRRAETPYGIGAWQSRWKSAWRSRGRSTGWISMRLPGGLLRRWRHTTPVSDRLRGVQSSALSRRLPRRGLRTT
jgi:hypothetical protein